jgi:YD repeat-containing protein
VNQPGVTPRRWTYNTKNQLTSESQPENGTTTYGRDAVGNTIQRTDAKGQTTTYTYDSNNTLTQLNAPGTLSDTQIAYDASDNRTSVVNGVVATSYGYDSANRMTGRTDVIGGRSFATTLAYDGNDNIASVHYPSGRVVAYTYDTENRVTSWRRARPRARTRSATIPRVRSRHSAPATA